MPEVLVDIAQSNSISMDPRGQGLTTADRWSYCRSTLPVLCALTRARRSRQKPVIAYWR
jgi:hypothetical protein